MWIFPLSTLISYSTHVWTWWYENCLCSFNLTYLRVHNVLWYSHGIIFPEWILLRATGQTKLMLYCKRIMFLSQHFHAVNVYIFFLQKCGKYFKWADQFLRTIYYFKSSWKLMHVLMSKLNVQKIKSNKLPYNSL